MSSLATLDNEFVRYLYNCCIKIVQNEKVYSNNTTRETWSFLTKYKESGYIDQLRYCHDKIKKYLNIKVDSYISPR